MLDKHGREISEPNEVLDCASSFYEDLFSVRDVSEGEGSLFLAHLHSRVPEEVVEEIEQPIELEELTAALKGMKSRKVPGSDGLGKDFYLAFWNVLGKDVLEVARAIFKQGKLGRSMKEGIITLI